MLIKLAQKNLRKRPLQSILLIIAITISLSALNVFIGLDRGLHAFFYEKNASGTERLEVRPKGYMSNFVSLIGGERTLITAAQIEEIKKIPDITKVHPETSLKGLSSIQINLLGQTLQSDAMVFALPKEAINDIELGADWDTATINDQIPVVLSGQLIDLYNFTFAGLNNLPKISPENLLGQEITILINQSTFFNFSSGEKITLRAKVVGFSKRVKLIGVTLPENIVREINKLNNKNSDTYIGAFIELTNPARVDAIRTQVEALGLELPSPTESFEKYSGLFAILTITLTCISTLIIIITALSIASSFFGNVFERTRHIGILRVLGANAPQIRKLFLLEASIIAFIAFLAAIPISFFTTWMIDGIYLSSLAHIGNKPDSLFLIDAPLLLFTLLFSQFFCLAAAWLPSRRAAKIEALSALNN